MQKKHVLGVVNFIFCIILAFFEIDAILGFCYTETTTMVISFSTKNYRSIKERIDFSMYKRGRKREMLQNSFHPDCLSSKQELLKSAVIYGANASGKSNLIRAVRAMQSVVQNKGVENPSTRILLEYFKLDKESSHEPILFEMELIARGAHYRYGFECTQEKIVSEWLYRQKKRMTLLFARVDNKFVESSPDFPELNAWNRVINDTELSLPENMLFLSTAAKVFAGGVCEAVQDWFENNLVVFSSDVYQKFLGYTLNALKDDHFSERISTLINKADFGIHNLTATIDDNTEESNSLSAKVATHHIVDGTSYSLDMFFNESEGTKKVFALSAPLIDILLKGKVLFIDELDAGLHPLLVSRLLEVFHDENTKNAQIIATAHSPSLLTETLFRRDQVWFANKLKNGVSTFVSLADFTGIRKNFSCIVKDYLHGCFGGIPYIKNLSVEK